jgi:hypothetical protein
MDPMNSLKIDAALAAQAQRFARITTDLLSLQLHEHLASVFAREELEKGGWRLLNAMLHRLLGDDVATTEPLIHLLDKCCALA